MKKGFLSIYVVYTFFIVFIIMMITTLVITNYKKDFLDTLKEDIKLELTSYSWEKLQKKT